MKGTVNPFEPWRPVESRIPPPLHVGRPWHPPSPPPARVAVADLPLVEPGNPPQRGKPPERPKQPQGQGGQASPIRTPISQWFVFVVLCVLGCIGLDSVGWYNARHVPRLIVLGVSVGMFASRVFNHRRGWYTRLRGMAIALVLAAIALWFVPTGHGVSLWSAYRGVEEMRALPPGDVAAYRRGAAARQTLAEDFPTFAVDVSAAEQAWMRRTVDEAIEKADRMAKNDPHEALAYLHQLVKDLSELKWDTALQKDLESARRRVLQACLKAAKH